MVIDITSYRSRIGTFYQDSRYSRKSKNSFIGNITKKVSRTRSKCRSLEAIGFYSLSLSWKNILTAMIDGICCGIWFKIVFGLLIYLTNFYFLRFLQFLLSNFCIALCFWAQMGYIWDYGVLQKLCSDLLIWDNLSLYEAEAELGNLFYKVNAWHFMLNQTSSIEVVNA